MNPKIREGQHDLYTVHVLADSRTRDGNRLTTLLARLPRFVLPELNTHRSLSRGTASTRAIPVAKRVAHVLAQSYLPRFAQKKRGMQAGDQVDEDVQNAAEKVWRRLLRQSVKAAQKLDALGVHKQWAGRPLELFSFVEVIITATHWSNFLHLRDHPDAQPELAESASNIWAALAGSIPVTLEEGAWHLPLVTEEDRRIVSPNELPLLSAGRCARVSFLGHQEPHRHVEDIALARNLLANGHLSPLEHPAQAAPDRMYGNFRGWRQLRKQQPYEWDVLGKTQDGRLESPMFDGGAREAQDDQVGILDDRQLAARLVPGHQYKIDIPNLADHPWVYLGTHPDYAGVYHFCWFNGESAGLCLFDLKHVKPMEKIWRIL